MPRAIDLHVHLPMTEWLEQSIGPLLPATEAYFRASVPRKTIEDVAQEYASRDVLDDVGADFPDLTLIAAHFGFPWFQETLAYALHKSNVYIELSGWAPKYLPAEVKREIGRRLAGQTLFGSDYPFIPLDRWFGEFEELELSDDARQAILFGNAARLLGLAATEPHATGDISNEP